MKVFSALFVIHILVYTISFATGQEWELVWADEFDGSEINQDNWYWEITAWGGGNNEFQVYTPAPENSFVSDGKLYIRPTLLEENINPQTGELFGPEFLEDGVLDLDAMYADYGGCTNPENDGCYRTGRQGPDFTIPPIASARLRSYQRFAFRYGKVEVMAKMPTGDWLWPAIWHLPENWCYGGWPVSGEIDLTEAIGNEDLRWEDGFPAGVQRMASTMHWGVTSAENRYYLTGNSYVNETNNYGSSLHLYEMEWTPNGFSFSIDGVNLLNVPEPLIDQNPEWQGFFEYGKPWDTIDEEDPSQNPWNTNNDPMMVPFDTQFHFLLNIAVGGTNWFIPDDAINRGGDPAYAKPWVNGIPQIPAMNDFYDARGQDETSGWLWTWLKERNNPDLPDNDSMQVDYVRVYKHADLPPEAGVDCPAAQ